VTASAMPVIAALPLLKRVRDRLAGALTAIDPKLRLVGVICMCDCSPTPVSATASGRVDAELAMDSVPAMVPDWVGAKPTCRVQLVPAASVSPGCGQVPAATV